MPVVDGSGLLPLRAGILLGNPILGIVIHCHDLVCHAYMSEYHDRLTVRTYAFNVLEVSQALSFTEYLIIVAVIDHPIAIAVMVDWKNIGDRT